MARVLSEESGQVLAAKIKQITSTVNEYGEVPLTIEGSDGTKVKLLVLARLDDEEGGA